MCNCWSYRAHIVEPEQPTCGIAGCTGGHYPQDHNEVAALRAELANMGDAVNVVDHHYREAMTALARADERARRAEAEVERMRSVVEAAIAVIETDKRLYHGSAEHAEAEAEAAFTALDEAVDAFRAAQGETNDA